MVIIPTICTLLSLIASHHCCLHICSILLIFHLHTVSVRLNEYTFGLTAKLCSALLSRCIIKNERLHIKGIPNRAQQTAFRGIPPPYFVFCP